MLRVTASFRQISSGQSPFPTPREVSASSEKAWGAWLFWLPSSFLKSFSFQSLPCKVTRSIHCSSLRVMSDSWKKMQGFRYPRLASWTCCVTEVDLALLILLPQPSTCWGYKCAPPCLLPCHVRNQAQGLVHGRQAVCQPSHILSLCAFLFHSESLSPLFLRVSWTFHYEKTNFFHLLEMMIKSMSLYPF